ncbi:MAG: DUF2007 domain-containing protein [Mobilitalea sp.]
MYCLKCGNEYNEDINICPDCHEELVAELPAESVERLEAMHPVMLKSVGSVVEAELIANLLHNSNIPALRKSTGVGGYMNIYMGYSVFGEEIYVDEDDYEKALQILKELDSYEEELDEGDDQNTEEDYENFKDSVDNENSEYYAEDIKDKENSVVRKMHDKKDDHIPFYQNARLMARIIIAISLGTMILVMILNSL